MRVWCAALAACVLFSAEPARAQTEAQGVSPSENAATAGRTIFIPANTPIEVELTAPLSSTTSRIGDLFPLRLRSPIIIDGREVVPAGATGGGEVIDADTAGFGGRAGKLILSARYLEIGGQRARIRSLRITTVGESRANTALAVSMIPYAGVAGIFVQGGEIELPAGAYGAARLATALELPETSSLTAPTAQPDITPALQQRE